MMHICYCVAMGDKLFNLGKPSIDTSLLGYRDLFKVRTFEGRSVLVIYLVAYKGHVTLLAVDAIVSYTTMEETIL